MKTSLIATASLLAWTAHSRPQNNVANQPVNPGAAFLDGLAYGTAKGLTITTSPLTNCQGAPYTSPIYNATYPAGIIASYMVSRDLYANETLSLYQPNGEDLCGLFVLNVAEAKGGACFQGPGETTCFSLSVNSKA